MIYTLQSRPDSTASAAGRGTLMLVIDDDPVFLAQIGHFARPQFEVIEYNSPAQIDPDALDRAQMIVLDLHMPGQDGIEFLTSLSLICPHKPVLIISGSDLQVVRMAEKVGVLLGMTHVRAIQKPVNLAQFRAQVDRMPADTEQDAASVSARTLSLAGHEKSRLSDRQTLFLPQLSIKTFDVLGFEASPPWARLLSEFHKNKLAALDLDLTLNAIEAAVTDFLPLVRDAVKTSQLRIGLLSEILANKHFANALLALAERYELAGHHIVFGFNETDIKGNSREVMASMARLKLHGFQLSLRVTGILSYADVKLAAEVFDEIVIDGELIRQLTSSLHARAAIENIMRSGSACALRVVADGVDDERTLSWLRQLGEPRVQGRLFSPPLNSAEVRAWLAHWMKQNS